jgi:ABC-type phosphate transport system auxiliary subunit
MHDEGDLPGVPVSSGFPPVVFWAGVVGIILIFTMGGLVLANSESGHMWPAESTLNLKLS